MQVGNIVKVIAPEQITGHAAGKMGIVTDVIEDDMLSVYDCIVKVCDHNGVHDVYLLQSEVLIISK